MLAERFPRTAEVYWARRGPGSSSSTAGCASEEPFSEYRPMQSPLLTRRSWDKLSSTRTLDTVLSCRVTEEKRELQRYYFGSWKDVLEFEESSDDESSFEKNIFLLGRVPRQGL